MESVCLNHPDTAAVTRCAVCGKPICSQCIVSKNGSNFCSEACASKASGAKDRVNDIQDTKKKTDKKSSVRTLIVIFFLIAAAAAGYFYYTQNKEQVDSMANKAAGNVQKSIKSTKKDLKKSIPTSSKYKRNREAMAE